MHPLDNPWTRRSPVNLGVHRFWSCIFYRMPSVFPHVIGVCLYLGWSRGVLVSTFRPSSETFRVSQSLIWLRSPKVWFRFRDWFYDGHVYGQFLAKLGREMLFGNQTSFLHRCGLCFLLMPSPIMKSRYLIVWFTLWWWKSFKAVEFRNPEMNEERRSNSDKVSNIIPTVRRSLVMDGTFFFSSMVVKIAISIWTVSFNPSQNSIL